MNIAAIIIETVVLLILFTVIVVRDSRDPINVVYDMPQPIIDRCVELGLIKERRRSADRKTVIKKILAAVVVAAVLAVIMRFVNGADTFREGFLVSYLIWLIIDWYDCIVLDWGRFCHSSKVIIPGTEDLADAYKDYAFHAIGSLKGMLIGLPVCLFVGLFVWLF